MDILIEGDLKPHAGRHRRNTTPYLPGVYRSQAIGSREMNSFSPIGSIFQKAVFGPGFRRFRAEVSLPNHPSGGSRN